jgi:hypothetical protein
LMYSSVYIVSYSCISSKQEKKTKTLNEISKKILVMCSSNSPSSLLRLLVIL